MHIKDLFYLQKNDRQALFVLLAITIVCISLTFIIGKLDGEKSTDNQTIIKHASKEHPVYSKEDGLVHELFPFDPNTATADDLLRLGLAPWQTRSIIRFREKGGIFSRPSDFARVYGITKKTYETLLPFIHIADDYKPASEFYGHKTRKRAESYSNNGESGSHYESERKNYYESESESTERPYTNKYSHTQKLKAGEQININTADTTELQKIPGIGNYFAKAIVRYRNQLGGFAYIEQLAEIKNFPSSAIDFIKIDAARISKININKLSFSQLCHHPYINTSQAKEIRDYRNKKGPLKNLDELKLLKGFSTDEIERLKPYVTF